MSSMFALATRTMLCSCAMLWSNVLTVPRYEWLGRGDICDLFYMSYLTEWPWFVYTEDPDPVGFVFILHDVGQWWECILFLHVMDYLPLNQTFTPTCSDPVPEELSKALIPAKNHPGLEWLAAWSRCWSRVSWRFFFCFCFFAQIPRYQYQCQNNQYDDWGHSTDEEWRQ